MELLAVTSKQIYEKLKKTDKKVDSLTVEVKALHDKLDGITQMMERVS